MDVFRTTLVAGGRRPYATWTFLVLPDALAERWGAGRKPVRGTLAGVPFRGTAARGEGVLRMPVPAALRKRAGVGPGSEVEVTIALDHAARTLDVPDELRAALAADDELDRLWNAMAPSHRRAWAEHVAEAVRPETRARRVERARAGIRARAFPGPLR